METGEFAVSSPPAPATSPGDQRATRERHAAMHVLVFTVAVACTGIALELLNLWGCR